MPREPRVYLEDILEAVRRIKSYAAGMDEAAFARSAITIDAVVRNLEIVGEAAARIPDELRSGASGIEWRKIVALRNILAHGYFGFNTAILWDVIATKIDPLERACRGMLEAAGR
jgi:uncharacterized protein with HEPN domain